MPITPRSVAAAVGRYLAGTLLVGALILGGLVVRTVQVGARDDTAPVDTIVVLGAAQYNGTPSPVYRARLDHAYQLFTAGVAAHVVTVGGNQAGDRTTEGAAGRDYLAGRGIGEEHLLAVTTGDDTLRSLRAVADRLRERQWHSVVLVTDPAHAFRASTMAKDLGLATGVSPVREGPATRSDVQLRYYTREVLGTLFYLVTGGSSHAGTPVL